jgi:hypothetical protein
LIGQRHPLEEVATKRGRKIEQPFGGEALRPSGQLPANLGEIDRSFGGVERDEVAVGHDARSIGRVDEGAKPAEGPPERAPRIVGNVPQKTAEALTAVTPPCDDEVGEERPGLPRRRKGDRSLVLKDLKISQESDRQRSHGDLGPSVTR